MPKIGKLYLALEEMGITVYINEDDCNSCSCARAEKDEVDDFVYIHQQAYESFKETGRAFIGWDLDNPKIVTDIVDSIDGLAWSMETPESKIEIFEPNTQWEVIDVDELEDVYLEDLGDDFIEEPIYEDSRTLH
jgi:hypothetical protein